jgi:hypothetical protein
MPWQRKVPAGDRRPKNRPSAPARPYFDKKGLFEENHLAIAADKIQTSSSWGMIPLGRTPNPE